MKNKYIKSEDISPVVGQKVYIQTLSGESLCVFSFQRDSPLFRWTPVENGLGSYYGDRSWRPYEEEVKHQYKNSTYEQPEVGQEVYISVADWPKNFPNTAEVLMTYQGRTDCHSSRVWKHANRGLFWGDRLWRPYVKEVVKPVWIDSRKEKPVPDSLAVWITHGPGEEVRAATFVRWYHPSAPSQPGCGWKVGVGGTTFIDPFFWQEREVPKVISPPEPMPEPVRTDGWLRLGAAKPENLQQVWVATVNEGVQPARYHMGTEHQGVQCSRAVFKVTYGPQVGNAYYGDFLLWQPRQAQPAYPIL